MVPTPTNSNQEERLLNSLKEKGPKNGKLSDSKR